MNFVFRAAKFGEWSASFTHRFCLLCHLWCRRSMPLLIGLIAEASPVDSPIQIRYLWRAGWEVQHGPNLWPRLAMTKHWCLWKWQGRGVLRRNPVILYVDSLWTGWMVGHKLWKAIVWLKRRTFVLLCARAFWVVSGCDHTWPMFDRCNVYACLLTLVTEFMYLVSVGHHSCGWISSVHWSWAASVCSTHESGRDCVWQRKQCPWVPICLFCRLP